MLDRALKLGGLGPHLAKKEKTMIGRLTSVAAACSSAFTAAVFGSMLAVAAPEPAAANPITVMLTAIKVAKRVPSTCSNPSGSSGTAGSTAQRC